MGGEKLLKFFAMDNHQRNWGREATGCATEKIEISEVPFTGGFARLTDGRLGSGVATKIVARQPECS